MVLRDIVADARPLSTLVDITITQEVSFKAFFYISTDLEEVCDHNYDVPIATPYITELLSMNVFTTRKSQQRAFYHQVIEVPFLRTAGGRIFEGLVHQYFQKKRPFSLGKPLDDFSDVGPVAAGTVFAIREWEEYRTLSELGPSLHRTNSPQVRADRENIYYLPLASYETAVDSFILTRFGMNPKSKQQTVIIMLQITVASSHDIKTTGIDALRAILPAEARAGLPHLVFIVPTGTRMQGAQTFIPSAGHSPWGGEVRQSILELSEEQLF